MSLTALKLAGVGAAVGLALLYANGGREVLSAYQEIAADPEATAVDDPGADNEDETADPTEYDSSVSGPSLAESILTSVGIQVGSEIAEKAVKRGIKAFKSKGPAAAGKVEAVATDAKAATKEVTAAAKAIEKVEAKAESAATKVESAATKVESAAAKGSDAAKAATKEVTAAAKAVEKVETITTAATKTEAAAAKAEAAVNPWLKLAENTKAAESAAVKAAEESAAKAATAAADRAAVAGARAAESVAERTAVRTASRVGTRVASAATKLAKFAGGPAALISALLSTIISVVGDVDAGSFDPCADGEYDLDSLPEAAKAAINAIPFLGDVFSLLSPILCFRTGCGGPGKEGYTSEEAGLCYKPCVPDYKSDGATICYKQYPAFEANGQGHTLTNITKRIYPDPGEVLSYCDGDKQGALCYPRCREGFEGILTVCRKTCPAGTNQTVVRCEKASYGRGVGRIPDKGPCPDGQRDDGTSCWEDWKCNGWCRAARNFAGDCWAWDWQLDCGGCGCIKKSLFDRQVCNADEELQGGLCYKKCVGGYHGEGPVCWSNDGPFDRETYDRGVGEPLKCPAGLIQLGALCYPVPPAGYERQSVGLLSQTCAPGSVDMGVGCIRESYNRGVGKIPLDVHMKPRNSYYGHPV